MGGKMQQNFDKMCYKPNEGEPKKNILTHPRALVYVMYQNTPNPLRKMYMMSTGAM